MDYLRTDLQPIKSEQTSGELKDIFQSIQKQRGFVPNLYKNLANAQALLSAYLQLA